MTAGKTPLGNPLRTEVESALRDVMHRHRLTVETAEYERGFGNGFVVMAAPGFRLRIVRDRGAITLDVSALGETKWLQLPRVVHALRGRDELSTEAIDLAKSVHVLEHYMDLLHGAFADPGRRQKLERDVKAMGQQRAQQMIQRRKPQ